MFTVSTAMALECPNLQGIFKCEGSGDVIAVATGKVNEDLYLYSLTLMDGKINRFKAEPISKKSYLLTQDWSGLANAQGIELQDSKKGFKRMCGSNVLSVVGENEARMEFMMAGEDTLKFGAYQGPRGEYVFINCNRMK